MAFTNQPGTLLGPLTTTWTAPASCSIYMPPCSTCDQGFRGQSCNAVSGGQVQDNTACWPPVTKGVASPSWPFVGWGFYSPGLACPAGYTTACTAVYGQRPEWDTQFTLVSSETAVGCCPTGFSCANINGNTCIATATSTSIPTAFCDGTDLTDSATETFPNVVTITQTNSAGADVRVSTSTRTTMMLYAPMFQLNFQASDLPASTTASTTEPTSSSSPSSSTSSAPDNDDGTSHSAGGLSSGAKVGLGVGLGLGIAFLLAFAGFIYYYRRSRRVQLPLGSELPNSEVSEAAHDSPKVVKPQSQVYEMGDYYAPAELPGNGHGGDHGGQNASRFA